MKRNKSVLLPKVLTNLSMLGENIRFVRLRRRLPMRVICEKAHISKPTLISIEKGMPEVSIGLYALVLNILGNFDDELSEIAKDDRIGRTIQDLNIKIPRRVRR